MEEQLDPKQFGVTPELFREWASPRFGNANPEHIKSVVWEWLVRSGISAYSARQAMGDPSIQGPYPTWTFERFGQSTTEMPDGRTVYIAGEHEDFYDSDFNIYNDVTVVHPDGTIDFYCYPREYFPPTDFHTATLVDGNIVIVGSLSYREERKPNETQVYLLHLEGFSMHKVETSGISPGWIHRHTATLSRDGKSIVVTQGKVPSGSNTSLRDNIDDWSLHLDDWRWERLTSRNWSQFDVRRTDRKMIHLWDMRHALWSLDHHMQDFYQQDMDRIEQFIGYRPNVELVRKLYHFDNTTYELHHDEETYNVFWIYVDNLRVRFTEEMHALQVMVEGELPPEKVSAIKQQLVEKLSVLVDSPCEVDES